MKKYIHPLEISEMMFCSCSDRQSITAAISTKDITKNLVRVRSSNIWAYGINIKNFGDKTGDVYVQFKGQNGGPEHIYVYYDVPIKTWKKMLSAPSKGHACCIL